MEVLVIPDLHGRDFWIEPCHNWWGSIVFLGDYHDPYTAIVGEPTKEESLENLRKLSKFVTERRKHPEKYDSWCSCLLGNHDFSYLEGNLRCRYDYKRANEVKSLLESLDLKIYHIYENNPTDKILFSHAGITQEWLDYHDITNIEDPNQEFKGILEEVPLSRGGNSKYGSPIWNSLSDYELEKHIPGYYQIFGHSQQESDPVIKEDYACLDCRKCFIVNTETKEIKEWNEQLLMNM